MKRYKTVTGFTLIEVMVAVALLAVALTLLCVISGRAIRHSTYAANLRTKSMLLEQKMAEISVGLEKKKAGDFKDEGYPEFVWKAQVNNLPISATPDSSGNKELTVMMREVVLIVRHREEEEGPTLTAYFLAENPEDGDKSQSPPKKK